MDAEAILKQIDSLRSGLAALELLVLDSQPKFPANKRELLRQEICLGCGEHRTAKNGRWLRGNHESCYRRIHNKIKAGELTDAEAVENGLLAPPDVSGRPKIETEVDKYLKSKKPKESRTND